MVDATGAAPYDDVHDPTQRHHRRSPCRDRASGYPALAQAGITTLEAVAQHSAKDLLALHGVGPKALRVLTDSLGERGLGFRTDNA